VEKEKEGFMISMGLVYEKRRIFPSPLLRLKRISGKERGMPMGVVNLSMSMEV
jgi:hypothetical protein